MRSTTRVMRPAAAYTLGPVVLLALAIAPAAIFHVTESWIWAAVGLALVASTAVIVWVVAGSQQLVYGPAGVYVVADDDNYTLTWDQIERFDQDTVVVEVEEVFRNRFNRPRRYADRGLVIIRVKGAPLHVSWINTRASARRLNDALGRFARRATPQLELPKPAGDGATLGAFGAVGVANVFLLHATSIFPALWLVIIAVDIIALCAYMGYKMSRGE